MVNLIKGLKKASGQTLVFAIALLLATPVQAQELLWARSAGGADGTISVGHEGRGIVWDHTSNSIAVDQAGNSYITGFFDGSTTFGAGEPNETILTGDRDIFLAKYNTDGNLCWVRSADGPRDILSGTSIAVDDLGNSYLTGDFWGMAIFGTGEPNETTLTGDYDIFVAKYDTKGNLRWARSAGGPYGGGSGIGIAVDNTGNSYVTGKYGGAVTFGAGEPNETTFSGPIVANLSDIFIAKYNVNGNLHWARSAGGPISASIGADIAVDDSGNSYITGSTYGSVTFGAGEPNEITFNTGNDGYHIFVARYDTDGNLGWVRNAGGLNNCNCPNNDGSVGIAIDDAGNNYITGFFDGSATFGAGEPNETTLTSKGIEDAFIAKYNADGNLGWVRSAGGHDPLIFSVSGGSDIDVDDAGNCYITGSFSGGSVTFGADEPNETTLTDSGGFFVAKYNRDGKLHWVINADAFSSKSIAVDDNGNSYITGDFRGPATFGAGEPNETILTGDSTSIFVAKYKGTLSEAIEDE